MTKQEIQELKASLSIREVIGRYMTLNRVGRRWMGLCPVLGDAESHELVQLLKLI